MKISYQLYLMKIRNFCNSIFILSLLQLEFGFSIKSASKSASTLSGDSEKVRTRTTTECTKSTNPEVSIFYKFYLDTVVGESGSSSGIYDHKGHERRSGSRSSTLPLKQSRQTSIKTRKPHSSPLYKYCLDTSHLRNRHSESNNSNCHTTTKKCSDPDPSHQNSQTSSHSHAIVKIPSGETHSHDLKRQKDSSRKHIRVTKPCSESSEPSTFEPKAKVKTSVGKNKLTTVNECCEILEELINAAINAIYMIMEFWTGNSTLLEQMLIQATSAFSVLNNSISYCKAKLLSIDQSNRFALSTTKGPRIDQQTVSSCEKTYNVENHEQYHILLRRLRKVDFKTNENFNTIDRVNQLEHMDFQCKEFNLSTSRQAFLSILKILDRVLSSETKKLQLAVDIYTVNEIFDENAQKEFEQFVLDKSEETD